MTRHRRGWLWYLGFVLLALTTVLVGTVGALGLHFQARLAPLWIALWSAALVAVLVVAFRRGLIAGVIGVLASLAVFSLWWVTITPTNDRDWQADVTELPSGSIDPDDA